MHFVRMFSEAHKIKAPSFDRAFLDNVVKHDWPGNVRELSNYVERSIITQQWSSLSSTSTSPVTVPDHAAHRVPVNEQWLSLNQLEKDYILKVLRYTNSVIGGEHGAAKILGLHPNTLRSRMSKLGIEKHSPNYE